ncbi:MAG: NAD(P)H-hydrate epimerase [Planctomycetes bacterium]|nr:NAD(P)H-hydrate epimerase [Planctomycetota bacterium]
MSYEDELIRWFGSSPHIMAEQARRVDQKAVETLGISSLVLMENAGLHASERALAMLPAENPCAVIFCGAGNNGGDGYVIARQLHLNGVQVKVRYRVGLDRLSGDALSNARIVHAMGLDVKPIQIADRSWNSCDLAIDALLGTGLRGALREDWREDLKHINATCKDHGIRTLAIDLPSGLNANTGHADEHTFRADETVTFVARKAAFAIENTSQWTGKVSVVSIGIPSEFVFQTLRSETPDAPGFISD